ncbi:MAG: alpha/beta fold hydrolase [Elusimicrobia bacterium]|nr:alpha/beta fold hydrolase [Elusimicrobiota bacterium]
MTHLLLCCAAALLSALPAAAAGQAAVHFKTSDGCSLEAFYLAPSSGAYVFVNVHGLGSDKNEWAPFQKELEKRGIGYLSLDLRGHGKSRACRGKAADYRNFSAEDWAAASKDIEAASAWLEKKGLPAGRQIFCGASVGANLALKAAAEGKTKPAALVLLSAGLEYAGVRADAYLPRAPKRVLLLASENDPYAWRSALLFSERAGGYGLKLSALDGGAGHGVNMFKTPGVAEKVIDWAKSTETAQR